MTNGPRMMTMTGKRNMLSVQIRIHQSFKNVPRDKWTNLEVSALGLEPVVDKALRISSKTQHELSLGLQLVDGLNGFMDLDKVKESENIN